MDEMVWEEKYRPRTLDECILSKETKENLRNYVEKGAPNSLFCGGPGIGKTTVAKAIINEMGADFLLINASLDRNIDTLRNKVTQFATSVSFSGGKKYVILDEADGLNKESFQPALRGFIQEYSTNCGFILTCNYKNKIIAPLHSRLATIDFSIPKDERQEVFKQIFLRLEHILKLEGVEYDRKVVAEILKKSFPDIRKMIGELQKHGTKGKIAEGTVIGLTNEDFGILVKYLKGKKFNEMRSWVVENLDNDISDIYKKVYTEADNFLQPASVPQLILTLADYQYKQAFAADPEVNLVAFLTEVMIECEFK